MHRFDPPTTRPLPRRNRPVKPMYTICSLFAICSFEKGGAYIPLEHVPGIVVHRGMAKGCDTASYLWWCACRCMRSAVIGSVSRAYNWVLFTAFLLGTAANLAGYKVTFAEGPVGTLLSGLTAVVLAWILVVVIGLFSEPFKLWKNGVWLGERFIFSNPVRVFTGEWLPSDNGSLKTFRYSGVPPNSFVEFQVVFTGGDGRIWGTLVLHQALKDDTTRYSGRGNIRTTSRQKFWLQCYSLPDTSPVIVHVDLIGWQR